MRTRYFSLPPARTPAESAGAGSDRPPADEPAEPASGAATAGIPGEAAGAIREAAEILRAGGIVAFPTETVYGLGVLRDSGEARDRLLELKERPEGLPLTVHLADLEGIEPLVAEVPAPARLLMNRYWPGPLTLVLPAREGGTVGLRVPSCEVARQLLRQVGAPVAATSANRHGQPAAVSGEEVRRLFDGRVDAILDTGETSLRQASAVVSVTGEGYRVLREGIITREMIHQLLVGKDILFVCTGNSCRSPMAAAIFQALLAEHLGIAVEDLRELGYTIHSAGVFAAAGAPASANAVAVMEERGIDIRGHRARQLTAEMIEKTDRIYALSVSHLFQIAQLSEAGAAKAELLCDTGVSDPIGGDIETYRRCADAIEAHLRRILEGY